MAPRIGIGELVVIFGIVVLLLFTTALVGGLGLRMGKRLKRGDAALDILRQRYARGEITLEQFENMKRDLS